ncbi:MAG: bifunctional adenosylcobinamide kinase/adenosylcobinamide-phosphate guanylyltransferase [Ruminococcaceae bacterium]|nr:bifunctional adenosylcobinamide kinase/adenosylcobinamide-phosphate guanylyltransferase [Oscillospiraceae bacterium]
MTFLVVGGAASGKSAYAERTLCKLSADKPRAYIATMKPFGLEAEARIKKHRAQRAGRGFQTIECYVNLKTAGVPPSSAVLLEDVGNLCANELFDPAGAGEGAADAVVRGVEALQKRCAALVIVSNEVASGGVDYAGDTLRYLRVLGEVNQRLAALADNVCEVVCGIAEYYKGEEPR